MFRKSLTALAAIAALSVPLAAQAQPMPVPDQPTAVSPQGPQAGAPRGPGVEILVAVAAVAVLGAVLSHGH